MIRLTLTMVTFHQKEEKKLISTTKTSRLKMLHWNTSKDSKRMFNVGFESQIRLSFSYKFEFYYHIIRSIIVYIDTSDSHYSNMKTTKMAERRNQKVKQYSMGKYPSEELNCWNTSCLGFFFWNEIWSL